jgi:hypothetical protein
MPQLQSYPHVFPSIFRNGERLANVTQSIETMASNPFDIARFEPLPVWRRYRRYKRGQTCSIR